MVDYSSQINCHDHEIKISLKNRSSEWLSCAEISNVGDYSNANFRLWKSMRNKYSKSYQDM